MSYENPVTYVDTESSKILANAISGIGQATSKIISDDIAKKAKIAEENKIENKKRAQAFKRYQIAGQENVNEATKDLDFTGNESFRNATSEIIDKLAKAKSDYEFSTQEDESKRLSKEIYELDSFLKNGFTGQMDDLQADVEMMREIMNNPGVEGGLDQFQDSNYTTMLIAMANGDDPGEMTFKIIDGKIEMTLKGDMYNQYRQDDTKGIYKVDLKANQSTEVARIPVLNMRKPQKKGGQSDLQIAGVLDDQGNIPVEFFSEEIGETKDLANNVTMFKYKINEDAENKIRSSVKAEVAGMLKGGEGLAGGFTSADSYYRNILLTDAEANGKVEGVMPFLETGSHEVKDDDGNVLYIVPVTEESYNAMVDRISEREIKFVNGKMAPQTRPTVATSTGGRGTEAERTRSESINNFTNEVSVDIATGTSVADIYNNVKNNISTYDYDPGTGFKSTAVSEKDYKEDIASRTPQELYDLGLIATFTESERKNPYQANSDKFKTTIQDKIDNYLADLGDSEDKFVNFNDGSSMNDKQALVALFKSTPKYANLKPSELQKLVNDAWSKRPKGGKKKEDEKKEFDGKKFVDNTLTEINSAYKKFNIN